MISWDLSEIQVLLLLLVVRFSSQPMQLRERNWKRKIDSSSKVINFQEMTPRFS
jgi:hypothetical protein